MTVHHKEASESSLKANVIISPYVIIYFKEIREKGGESKERKGKEKNERKGGIGSNPGGDKKRKLKSKGKKGKERRRKESLKLLSPDIKQKRKERKKGKEKGNGKSLMSLTPMETPEQKLQDLLSFFLSS